MYKFRVCTYFDGHQSGHFFGLLAQTTCVFVSQMWSLIPHTEEFPLELMPSLISRVRKRGSGGRRPGPDPHLDPSVDPSKAHRLVANR